jgi:hypothetical protein
VLQCCAQRSHLAPGPLSSRRSQVAVAATGVKFLHHEALKYDIGVYFEANGHGTVLFRDSAVDALLARKVTS